MRNRLLIFAGAAGLLGAAGLGVSVEPPAAGDPPQAEHAALADEAGQIARAGDVLFKTDGGLWGRIADSFSDAGDGFGHVGIVADGPSGAGGSLVVIHAGGDPVSREGRVQETPLAEFLAVSKAAALYRPTLSAPETRAAIDFARAAAARGAPFDSKFSLDSADQLYCTELIWRALSVATGADAIPKKSTRQGRLYVALDDVQESERLALHWRSPATDHPK